MRYGFIGYVQVTKQNGKIVKEKVLRKQKPDPEVKLSKQIKSLMKTALFQTNESIWRLGIQINTGIIRQPPARPKGIVNAPSLLATRLSDIFYTDNADYVLKHWKELDTDKFRHLGRTAQKYGAAWQPIYDLVSDDPEVHIKLLKRLLKVLEYPVAENFSTTFCFGLVNLKRYKSLVSACPKLLRPYLCLMPRTVKEHDKALAWATSRKYLRVALNVNLFAEPEKKKSKKPLKLPKTLKAAYKQVLETWEHYYGGRFVPLAMLDMDHIDFLPPIAKYCNVVITDFDPISKHRPKVGNKG